MMVSNALLQVFLATLWLSHVATSTFAFVSRSVHRNNHHHQEACLLGRRRLQLSRDWIDEVREDELLDDDDGSNPHTKTFKPDMRYIPRNVLRQNQNFVAIREAAGPSLTNDVYIRDPRNQQVFWFVGKLARISDVTPAQAIARQWNLIETHAANLRPLELFPNRGQLEIWIAPGDSEMDVAYNRPTVVFEKVTFPEDTTQIDALKSITMGFQGEMYEGGEEGFRTWRNEDGTPANPEVTGPSTEDGGDESTRAPTDQEMVDIESMLQGQDINELYKEQQRRAGRPVDEDD